MANGWRHHSIGAPYLIAAADMRRLAPLWADLTPLVYTKSRGLEADMYAYAMAAAHLQLRHTRVEHLMLSNSHAMDMLTWQQAAAVGYEASREGWQYVDDVFFPEEAPNASHHPCHCHTPVLSSDPRAKLPTLLHYCQPYKLFNDDPAGTYAAGFAKWSMPSTILLCDSPLLEEPWAPTPQSPYIYNAGTIQVIIQVSCN